MSYPLNWSDSRIADLSRISIPTLVIFASEDLLVPESDLIASEIPDATLLVVEGAGHAVALESPGAVNEAILAHLGRESI
jgi:pimeloyl-ACP methyl ester carboxylesterase